MTEIETVSPWITAARWVLLVAFCAAIPTIVGLEHGRMMFWAAAVPILPLLWVIGGYHLWRRLCPVAFVSQIPKALGLAGKRRVGGWLSRHYMLLQLGLMVVALTLRLLVTNGTPWGLAGFLIALAFVAITLGFFYTGKTWCNFVCPVGAVEKFYTEPSRSRGPATSKCAPCTACKKNCPDIDYERGYWREQMSSSRRFAYYAWPGLVFSFYLYYYLVSGSWDYYFSGSWTFESDQMTLLLGPGLFFLNELPRAVAAPLTLIAFGLMSFGFFALVERIAFSAARRKLTSEAEIERRRHAIRHKMLVGSGFIAFLVFYLFGGQPIIHLAAPWVGNLFSVVVVVAATTIFWNRVSRHEYSFPVRA